MNMLLALCLALFPQGEARRLVEQLRSDAVVERDEAEQGLLKLGSSAAPELRKAAEDKDPEVASRAKRLLRVLELREKIPPRLAAAFPGLADRLALDDDRAWCEAFFQATHSGSQPVLHESLEIEDADFLAARAFRGSRTDQERLQLAHAVTTFGLRSAIPELVHCLRQTSPYSSHIAHQGLVGLGAVEAVPAVLELMKTDDARQAAGAQRILLDLKARSVAPELIRLLKDSRIPVRANAAVLLGGLGCKESVGPLLERLSGPPGTDLPSVIHALGELRDPSAVPPLRERLRDTNLSLPAHAAEALAKMGAKEAVPDLIGLLSGEFADAAASALGALGATEAVPALVKTLGHEDEYAREEAAAALGTLGVRACIPRLRPLIRDDSGDVRVKASLALIRLGDTESVGPILETFADAEEDVRDEIFGRMVHMDLIASKPALLALLRNREKAEIVRRAAALLLVRLGEGAALRDIATNADEPADLRATAIHALGPAEGEAVQALLSDANETVREIAVLALGRIGRREAAGAVAARLQDDQEEYDVRRAAARALGFLPGPRTVPALVEALKDSDHSDEIARSLGRLQAREAVPALLKLLEEDDSDILAGAAEALHRLDPEAARAKLRGRLKDPRRAVRGWVAAALCRLGDRDAAPVLIDAARKSPLIRLDALNALRHPARWRSLEDRFTAVELLGESAESSALMGLMAGTPVEGPGQGTLHFSSGRQRHWDSATQALADFWEPFILEEGLIRVLPRPQAVRFWQEWLKESGDK